MEAVLVAYLLDLVVYGTEVQFLVFHTQNDVLGRCEDIDQVVMLVDHSDSESIGVTWGPDGYGIAVLEDLAAVRLVDA